MIKNIKDEKELIEILKVVSNEAVKLSKKIVENADPSLSSYKKQYAEDEKRYGNLSEVEDEEAEEEASEEPAVPEEAPEEAPEQSDPEPSGSDDEGVVDSSFDSVVKAVNNLRAGKSLRDSSIKQQAQDYYDKLSDPERTTLLVFLKAISDIIAGQVDGRDAQDPSDPPARLNITQGTGSKSQEPETEEAPVEEPEEEAEEEETQSFDQDSAADYEESEDTTPPIKVNESQDIEALRKKIRRLMLRG